jgi:hypothetical protein
MLARFGLIGFAATIAMASPAVAQEHNSFAIGVHYDQRLANDESAHGNGGIGLSWRIGHSDEGWGWSYGMGWFATDIDRAIGGRNVPFGELKVRPIVGGYGYTHKLTRRWYVTGDLVGGLAFTTFTLSPEASRAIGAETDGSESHIRVIPVIRPEARTWYDLNRKWGVTFSGWYTVARPSVTLVTPTSRETLHPRVDTFSIAGGIVYRIF